MARGLAVVLPWASRWRDAFVLLTHTKAGPAAMTAEASAQRRDRHHSNSSQHNERTGLIMVTPPPSFTVTLTSDERDWLIRIIELVKHETEHPTALAALQAAKPKRGVKKPEPITVPAPFEPNTGEPAVDAFMRRKHDPAWTAPPTKIPNLSRSIGNFPTKPSLRVVLEENARIEAMDGVVGKFTGNLATKAAR